MENIIESYESEGDHDELRNSDNMKMRKSTQSDSETVSVNGYHAEKNEDLKSTSSGLQFTLNNLFCFL
jgi:hypothetical protein